MHNFISKIIIDFCKHFCRIIIKPALTRKAVFLGKTDKKFNICTLAILHEIHFFFSFTLYPTHSRVGRGNLVLRHSVPQFPPISGGIAC